MSSYHILQYKDLSIIYFTFIVKNMYFNFTHVLHGNGNYDFLVWLKLVFELYKVLGMTDFHIY